MWKKDHPWYVPRISQRCSFFHTCHGATSKVLDTSCMDCMHSVRYLFKASKTVCNPGLLFTWCTARTLRLSIESCTAARPWRRSCFFVTAAKDSAALSPPTTLNPNRSSRAQPCFTRLRRRLSSAWTKPFFGITDRGVNKCLMWLIPLSEGTLVSEAADCSAGDPSAAAKCKPYRSFLGTGNTFYYYRIIIIASLLLSHQYADRNILHRLTVYMYICIH